VETSAHGITAPSAVYEIAGRRFEIGSRGFAEAIADAHAAHQRPRCMCLVEGVEMYVARLGDGYIVKRMPGTGSHHAPDCPSYEPPADCSGLGQVLGTAICEDPATGETTLRLDFTMSRMSGRPTMPATAGAETSAASDGTRLSLRGLLHYLWDQAELTRWHPGFAGRRNWATVRRHLLHAAEGKIAKSATLAARLYIPEVFSVDRRDAIHSRRTAQWARAAARPDKPQQLMLIVAEVKGIEPARYGHRVVFKHVPDQAFGIDEQLYRRMARRFEHELTFWATASNLHMVMIATFGVSEVGVPTVAELCLMTVTGDWLPVEDAHEQQLVERLVRDGRAFVKELRYNLPPWQSVACAVLTDVGETPCALWITTQRGDDDRRPSGAGVGSEDESPVWAWNAAAAAMPALPSRQRVSALGFHPS
jgi:hypothetical protein